MPRPRPPTPESSVVAKSTKRFKKKTEAKPRQALDGSYPGRTHPLGLLDLAEEDTLHQYGLRSLRTHVRVGWLLGHEDAADLAELRVHLVHLHLNGALADVEHLVAFLEELLLPALAVCLQRWQCHRLVVARIHAAALRVQEAARAV